ncbi:MAG: NAD(P)-dependent alcohol dehydrogenase [Caldilineaceae bacterium]|nr:NAD(P)-dependent alcohol dehydrogenase [Caldilineaceae bacterium]
MKAIVYTEYGPPEVLHLAEVAKPTPKENEILIRVHAAPVNYGDTLARNFANVTARDFNMPAPLWLLARLAFGFRQPKKPILGSELAGEIEAVGKAVTQFRPGDQVFAYSGMNMGAYAEYLCLPATGMVAHKPANLSYAEAAALPYGGIMALALLRKANLQPGQKVLINGASGGIGVLAVQIAKHWGAHVTGVCSTLRVDYVKTLGADQVLDYTQTDFTQSQERYDLVFDILGRSSFARCRRVLQPNGIYLLASFKSDKLLQMLATAWRGGQKVICAFANEQVADLVCLKELAEAGQVRTIVDRCYPLAAAAAAHRYYATGQKAGHVLITMT